jgi:hypothetical protein
VVYAVGLVVLAGATTAAYLAMRDVMAIGGSCASGGPYEVATPCPKGTGLLMVGGILGWFVGAGLTAVGGWQLRGAYGSLALLAWPALFLSLGWNFVDFGLDPAGGGDTDGGLLSCGVLFFLMGGVPLVLGLKGLARALWPTAVGPGADGRGAWRLSAQARMATGRRRGPADVVPADVVPVDVVPVDVVPVDVAPGDVVPADVVPGDVVPGDAPSGEGAPTGGVVAELERLADLHGRGALDDEEFERAKGVVLGRAAGAGTRRESVAGAGEGQA